MEENPRPYGARSGRTTMARTLRDVPLDLVINILSRLEVKSLLRCRCVCKPWRALVADPNFIHTHLSQSYVNNKGYVFMVYDFHWFSFRCDETFVHHSELARPLDIMVQVDGYFNGLLCLSHDRCPIYKTKYYKSDIYLWNPFIRKLKALPNSEVKGRHCCANPKFAAMYLALGFVSQTNDYKVVKFVYRKRGPGRSVSAPSGGSYKVPPRVEVYSLRLNFWKRIQNVVPCVICCTVNGVANYSIVNGIVHWVAKMDSGENGSYEFILSFDMAKEEFGKIALPECCHDGRLRDKSTVVLKESLSLLVYSQEGQGSMEIWVMKENGAAKSWTKQFTLDQWVRLFPLGFLKNGEVVLRCNDRKLVLYDPRVQQVKHLHISDLPDWIDVFTYCVESLVLLNEGN